MTGDGHYEVDLFEPGGPGEGARWQPVTVFSGDAIPTPLTFGSLSEALVYAERDLPSTPRIIWVTKEGERLVIEPREVAS